MLEETETEETRVFLSHFCHWWHFNWRRDPWLRLCAGQFVLEIRKLLATSEAEFNALIGAGMGSKPFGTKAEVIFAFREKIQAWTWGSKKVKITRGTRSISRWLSGRSIGSFRRSRIRTGVRVSNTSYYKPIHCCQTRQNAEYNSN